VASVEPARRSVEYEAGVLNAPYGAYREDHRHNEHRESAPRDDIGRCHHQTIEGEQHGGAEGNTDQGYEARDNTFSDGRSGAQEHRVKTDWNCVR